MPTEPYVLLRPRFHKELGREVPTTAEGRVRLGGGPLIRPRTLAGFEQMQAQAGRRVSQGQIVDALYDWAQLTDFDICDTEP